MARGLGTRDDGTGLRGRLESVRLGVIHFVCHEHERECRQKSVIKLMSLKVERCCGSCCCHTMTSTKERGAPWDYDEGSSVQGDKK